MSAPQNSTDRHPAGKFDLNRRHRPILFLGGHAIFIALVFIFPFVLTHAVDSKGAYARLTVYINWMTMLIDLGNLGVGRALQQLAIQTPEEELKTRLAGPLQGALAVVGAILAGLTAAFAWAALARPGWFEGEPRLAFWLWLAVALGLVRLCFSYLLYGLRHYRWYIGIDVAWAALRIAIVPLAWKLGGAEGVLAGSALLWAVALAFSIAVVTATGVRPARGPWRRAVGELAYFLRLGFWMHLTWLAPTLARPVAVLLLAWRLGRSQAPVGLAHLSISILTAAAVLLDSLFMSLYPEKARAGVEGRRGELTRWAGEEARALGFLLWPLAAAAAWLMWIPVRLLPPDYRGDMALWLTPIALALPARAMAAPLITALQAGHRPARGAFYQVLRLATDVLGIFLSLAFWKDVPAAPAWGILAGEWAATGLLFVLQQMDECGMWNEELRKEREEAAKNRKEECGMTGSADALVRSARREECGMRNAECREYQEAGGGIVNRCLAALRQPPLLRAGALLALVAAWMGEIAALGPDHPAQGLAKWGCWLATAAAWYLLIPLAGIVNWRSVKMTFTPQRAEANAERGMRNAE